MLIYPLAYHFGHDAILTFEIFRRYDVCILVWISTKHILIMGKIISHFSMHFCKTLVIAEMKPTKNQMLNNTEPKILIQTRRNAFISEIVVRFMSKMCSDTLCLTVKMCAVCGMLWCAKRKRDQFLLKFPQRCMIACWLPF